MAQTLIEKIIARNAGVETVTPDEIVTVRPNRVMIHDIFIPFVAEKFYQMGFKEVAHPDSVVLIYDHLVPAANTDDLRHFKIGDAFAKKQGITNVHRSDGICHQLMVEQGYVRPGDVVFGTDSHTTTYGAVGAFASGIGYTEMASALGTGELWLKVPHSIKITINGTLPANVSAKDVILTVIGDLGAAGGTYKCLAFKGDTCQNMSLASRMTIANMAVEAGAKCAVFEADDKALKHAKTGDLLRADGDAVYCKTLSYNAADFVPVAACPSQVDNIQPVASLGEVEVDQVFIGSCTNGRLEDLQAAAALLKGKKIAPFTRLVVTPASRDVYTAAAEQGVLETLPGCGLCCGRNGGILAGGETVVSTSNRNFIGRMGDSSVQIYLTSPAVAAATALTGTITVP